MVKTFEHTKIIGRENITFGDPVWLDDFVLINARRKIVFGSYIHLAAFSSISGDGELYIGDFTGFSYGVRILLNDDSFDGSGLNNPCVPQEYRIKAFDNPLTIIGSHCLIGANSVIYPDITLGNGCSVGALSFVKDSFPPFSVIAGIPARFIKKRESKQIKKFEHQMIERGLYTESKQGAIL